jgi:hypothetical protein
VGCLPTRFDVLTDAKVEDLQCERSLARHHGPLCGLNRGVKYWRMIGEVAHGSHSQASLFSHALPVGRCRGPSASVTPPCRGSRDMPAAMHRCCLVFPVNGMPAVFRSCSASPGVTKARAYPAAPFESLKKRYFISRTHPNGPAHRILQFCTVHPRQVRVARLESRRAQYPG